MTHPPEKMGLKTCRTIPPTWNSGIRLQLTSDGDRSQLSAIVAAAVSMSPIQCGTSFLFPVVPDVNSTSTLSSAALGSVERVPPFSRRSGDVGSRGTRSMQQMQDARLLQGEYSRLPGTRHEANKRYDQPGRALLYRPKRRPVPFILGGEDVEVVVDPAPPIRRRQSSAVGTNDEVSAAA